MDKALTPILIVTVESGIWQGCIRCGDGFRLKLYDYLCQEFIELRREYQFGLNVSRLWERVLPSAPHYTQVLREYFDNYGVDPDKIIYLSGRNTFGGIDSITQEIKDFVEEYRK